MQQPSDGMARDQQEEISYQIQANIDEVVELALLSSKQLFEGILVDLDPIDREKLVNRFLPSDPTCASLMDALQHILETMTKNANAARGNAALMEKLVRNAKDLSSGLAQLRDLVQEEIEKEDSEQRRAELTGILQTLDQILKEDILATLRVALSDPSDGNVDDLLQAIARMANALDRLNRVLSGEEDFDMLNGSVSKLQGALQALRAAMEQGDSQGMLHATKDAVTRMQAQTGTVEDVAPALRGLVEGTKAAMANPQDKDASSKLLSALEQCSASTYDLSPSANLPRAKLVNSLHQLQRMTETLLETAPKSESALHAGEGVRNSQNVVSSTLSYYQDNFPQQRAILARGLQKLQAASDGLIEAHAARNLHDAKEHETAQRIAAFDLIEAALQVESADADTDSLIESVGLLNHVLTRLNEASKMGDRYTAEDSSNMAQHVMGKESLLAEMIAKRRIEPSNPERAERMVGASEELQALRREVPEVTTAVLKDITKHPKVTTMIAKVRNVNEKLLNEMMTSEEMEDKVADINISLEVDSDHIEDILSAPTSQPMEDIEAPLATVAEQIGHQQLLSHCLLQKIPKDSQASRRDGLRKALLGVDGTLNRLRTAAADAMAPGADRIARNRLKKALNDITVKSEALTEASQSSLIHRLLANGQAFNTACVTIANTEAPDVALRTVKDGKAVKRFEKQMLLAHQMANQCNDPQLKLVTRKLIGFGETAIQECKQRAIQAQDASQVAPHFDRLRQVNEKIMIAAQRAEKCSQQADINSLSDAAQRMMDASELLIGGDTPKGQLIELAKKIGIEMKKMSDSADAKNKRGIITSAKTISQMTSQIVKIAAAIPSTGANKRFRNEMLSMAHAAQNYSVVCFTIRPCCILIKVSM